MPNKRQDTFDKLGSQPSKNDSSRVKNGYAPVPTSERAPAPPPKNP